MRLFLYICLISQILNFLDVFTLEAKEDPTHLNKVEWRKVKEKSKPLKKIIWKSYKNDQIYFDNKIEPGSTISSIFGRFVGWFGSKLSSIVLIELEPITVAS